MKLCCFSRLEKQNYAFYVNCQSYTEQGFIMYEYFDLFLGPLVQLPL